MVSATPRRPELESSTRDEKPVLYEIRVISCGSHDRREWWMETTAKFWSIDRSFGRGSRAWPSKLEVVETGYGTVARCFPNGSEGAFYAAVPVGIEVDVLDLIGNVARNFARLEPHGNQEQAIERQPFGAIESVAQLALKLPAL